MCVQLSEAPLNLIDLLGLICLVNLKALVNLVLGRLCNPKLDQVVPTLQRTCIACVYVSFLIHGSALFLNEGCR